MSHRDKVPDVGELLENHRRRGEELQQKVHDHLFLTLTGVLVGMAWGATVTLVVLAVVHPGIVSPRPALGGLVVSLTGSVVIFWLREDRRLSRNLQTLQDNLVVLAISTLVALGAFALGVAFGSLRAF